MQSIKSDIFEKKAKKETPLSVQVLCCCLAVSVLLLFSALCVTLHFSLSSFQKQTEDHLRATAVSLANSEMVREAFLEGEFPEELVHYLDEFLELNHDIDVISMANTDSVRLYHVVHDRIGETFVGGDQDRALQGESYFSNAVGTMGLQRRYLTPVRDAEGTTVLGFVCVSTTMTLMKELQRSIFLAYLKISLAMLAVLVLLAGVFSAVLRKSLLGFTPKELVQAYLERGEVLNGLEEGIISTDNLGRIQFANQAAEQMLCSPAGVLERKQLDELLTAENGESLTGKTGDNILSSSSNILVNCAPQNVDGKPAGMIFILRDKSDALRKAEQLNGCRCMISALRANSHEFMNKLQVISGLIQMNHIEEALAYIGDVSEVQTKAINPISRNILNRNVAALLLGKLSNTKELGIQLILLPNSSLPEHSAYLSTNNLVTIIGNLLENAIEATAALSDSLTHSVELQILEDEAGLLIQVSDTGIGIEPENLSRIFDLGFSTKASQGRGIGMAMVQEIVEQRRGSMDVDSEPGVGTTFTLIFQEKR